MPPRFAYWTILAGGLPTAFRAADRDELLPTFKRLQHTHPDATLKYFARGRLWNSPEEARAALTARPTGERRDRNWRPGGQHRDPRQPFKEAKRERNQRWRKKKFERRTAAAATTFEPRGPRKPHGDPMRKPATSAKRRDTKRGAGGSQRPSFRRDGATKRPRRR